MVTIIFVRMNKILFVGSSTQTHLGTNMSMMIKQPLDLQILTGSFEPNK